MKLLELLPDLEVFKRVKRPEMKFYLIRSEYSSYPLIKLDMANLKMEKYIMTYDDLIADDWGIV